MDHAFARQHAAAIVHQRAAQRALVEAHRDLVRKTGQDTACDRAGPGFALRDVETFGFRDGEKLFPKLACLARRAGVHSEARATTRIEVVFFRETKGAQQDEEIGFIFAAEKIFALVAHLFSLRAAEEVASLGEGGDQRNPADAALVLGREQHAGVARVTERRACAGLTIA